MSSGFDLAGGELFVRFLGLVKLSRISKHFVTLIEERREP